MSKNTITKAETPELVIVSEAGKTPSAGNIIHCDTMPSDEKLLEHLREGDSLNPSPTEFEALRAIASEGVQALNLTSSIEYENSLAYLLQRNVLAKDVPDHYKEFASNIDVSAQILSETLMGLYNVMQNISEKIQKLYAAVRLGDLSVHISAGYSKIKNVISDESFLRYAEQLGLCGYNCALALSDSLKGRVEGAQAFSENIPPIFDNFTETIQVIQKISEKSRFESNNLLIFPENSGMVN